MVGGRDLGTTNRTGDRRAGVGLQAILQISRRPGTWKPRKPHRRASYRLPAVCERLPCPLRLEPGGRPPPAPADIIGLSAAIAGQPALWPALTALQVASHYRRSAPGRARD